MTEVTIEITQFCEYECDYCSSNASQKGEHLNFEKIINFIDGIDSIHRINISGGEPLAHPDFYKILRYCQEKTDDVRVYTNALEHIIFNSDVIQGITLEANVCIVPGREIFIPEDVARVHLLKLVHQGRAEHLPRTFVTVSQNFNEKISRSCIHCNNILLQADGQVVRSPCKKKYSEFLTKGEKNKS